MLGFSDFWVLDRNGEPRRCSAAYHARWWLWAEQSGAWRVARDELAGGVEVSTVFLVCDHGARQWGPPILFETMIFGGAYDCTARRYFSRREAFVGHRLIVSELQQLYGRRTR